MPLLRQRQGYSIKSAGTPWITPQNPANCQTRSMPCPKPFDRLQRISTASRIIAAGMAFLKGKAPSDKSESTAAAGFSLRCFLRLGGFSACPHPNGRFPMPLDLRNGFFPQILDQSGRCQVANPCPGNNDDIQIGRQLGFQFPIRLSNEPFCTISLHRIADRLPGGDASRCTPNRFGRI